MLFTAELADAEAQLRRHLRLAELLHKAIVQRLICAPHARLVRHTVRGLQLCDGGEQLLVEPCPDIVAWRQAEQVGQRAGAQHHGVIEVPQRRTQVCNELGKGNHVLSLSYRWPIVGMKAYTHPKALL